MVLAIMLVVITGGIGSGKTYVAKIFEQLSIPVIYADQLVKEIIVNNTSIRIQINQYFNTLDFKKINTQIFKHKKKRLFLEKLIHPKVLEQIMQKITYLKTNNNLCIIEIPLLHNLFNILEVLKTDKLILINCEQNIQISRIMHRNKLSKSKIMLIIKSQLSSAFAINKIQQLADYVLNGDSLEQLQIQVITLCSWLNNILNNNLNDTLAYQSGIK